MVQILGSQRKVRQQAQFHQSSGDFFQAFGSVTSFLYSVLPATSNVRRLCGHRLQ